MSFAGAPPEKQITSGTGTCLAALSVVSRLLETHLKPLKSDFADTKSPSFDIWVERGTSAELLRIVRGEGEKSHTFLLSLSFLDRRLNGGSEDAQVVSARKTFDGNAVLIVLRVKVQSAANDYSNPPADYWTVLQLNLKNGAAASKGLTRLDESAIKEFIVIPIPRGSPSGVKI
jgi:hypothetical protein